MVWLLQIFHMTSSFNLYMYIPYRWAKFLSTLEVRIYGFLKKLPIWKAIMGLFGSLGYYV